MRLLRFVAPWLAALSSPALALDWSEVQKLSPADSSTGDSHGIAVDLSGDRLVVASIYDDVGTNANQGSAYVYALVSGAWVQEAKLVAFDGQANDEFSTGVAIDGDTVVVGSPRSNGVGPDAGAVYVYTRGGTAWSLQQKITPLDAQPGDAFGRAVALEGDTLVVGADDDDEGGLDSGSAYVFTRSGSTWTESAKLVPADGQQGDSAGRNVAISGDTLVFGAHADDDVAPNAGSAYVYVRAGTTWAQQAKLVAADGQNMDNFGRSVGVAGDTLVVTAWLDDDGATDGGSAYVWTRSGTTWALQQKIVPFDASVGENFGKPVALGPDVLVVGGVRDEDLGFDSGSVYVYRRAGATWTLEQKILASDGGTNDIFGSAVAIEGARLVVGAAKDDAPADESGSAYVLEFSSTIGADYCPGDGSGAACPCGNVGLVGHGCASSVSTSGARLTAQGNASLAADSVVLSGLAMPDSSALYFQGTIQVASGAGSVFGDGLRCVAGSVQRLGTKMNALGASQYPGPLDPSVSVRGAIASPGTRHYQVWYRNAASFCTTSTFNLSNGLTIAWAW